ncbi:MAG: hypothetical protein EP343_34450 [Deltaproteobacteria bacterium]|nr:MAG: hypothetical protein EP343_34450 [Deltaproteobacteria bacterium]
MTCITSSCLPTFDYAGIACDDDSVCGNLICLEGLCRNPDEIIVTSMNGDGLQAPPTYPNPLQRPKEGKEATRRFRKTWRIQGHNLHRLTGLKLKTKQAPRIEYTAKDGLALSGNNPKERVVMLPKNLVAGMFVLIGLVGNTEVALGEVFILQGEGCKITQSQGSKLTIRCGVTESTIEGPTGSGLSTKEKEYLNALQETVKVDPTARKVTFDNVNVHIENGLQKTASVNGRGNLIVGYHETGGQSRTRTGSHNIILGPEHSYSSYGSFVAGKNNQSTGAHASVLGGQDNLAEGEMSTVVGGNLNKTYGPESSILGGQNNQTGAPKDKFSGQYGAVSGGERNIAVGLFSSVSGGIQNVAEGIDSSVSGGEQNTAWSVASSVTGGLNNDAGSASNRQETSHATVNGGRNNIIYAKFAVINGGFTNKVTGTYGSVHGGSQNEASGEASTVVGGNGNKATQKEATALGGNLNQATSEHATVLGGKGNKATATSSTVMGGESNTVSTPFATLLGGKSRTLNTTNSHTCNTMCP